MYYVWQLELKKCRQHCYEFNLKLGSLALVLCLIVLAVSCSTISSSSISIPSNSPTSLSLTPDNATVESLAHLQFTARVSGTANTAVTWSASAGTISGSGLFTAPEVNSNTPVFIKATSGGQSAAVYGTTGSVADGFATVTVTPPASLAITTLALPIADASVPYSASLTATGGVAPYVWSLANGSLPAGILLQSPGGVISGTTALAGSYPLTAKVSDAAGHSATSALNLTVSASSPGGAFDGPAELPVIYIQTAMANTPAPGSVTTVSSGGDFQSALNNASCGDTIQLQAGATFTGAYTFPAKNCNDNDWIIVRTSADDSLLPPEGSRLTPCYAGVSSLPGRPALNCASTNKVVASLSMSSSAIGPVIFASGANYYRLIGLEITRAAGTGFVSSLASVIAGGTANNIIFDRVWMHGTAQDDTNRGLWLEGGSYISAIDSYFSDFHCVSVTGACTDAQAIAGGVGAPPMGPYKITDDFLEASGESILFGGDGATGTPADIQISQNHMFKPLRWMQGQPGYIGGRNGNPFIVKNLIELKNAKRVLLEGNIMEDTWGGFSQSGFAVLITPKNQSGPGSSNLCPICEVTDVTLRYTTISHVGAGLQIANALSDNGGPPLDGERYSIHDIVIDDINGVLYGGPSQFAEISTSEGAPLLKNVTINHVTAFPSSTMLVVGDQVAISTPMSNFIFTNNLINAGAYPVWSTGDGGATNCAYSDVPLTTFNACFASSVFSTNAMIAAPSGAPAGWPSGNFFPALAAVQFVNYNGGNGGNYQLLPSSPYKNRGTDGMDLGANIEVVNSSIAGVQ
jgi:hypothetical protein